MRFDLFLYPTVIRVQMAYILVNSLPFRHATYILYSQLYSQRNTVFHTLYRYDILQRDFAFLNTPQLNQAYKPLTYTQKPYILLPAQTFCIVNCIVRKLGTIISIFHHNDILRKDFAFPNTLQKYNLTEFNLIHESNPVE
jgi:hypothetical protein